MKSRRSVGHTILEVFGAVAAAGVAYALIRELPTAARYMRMLSIAKPHRKMAPTELIYGKDHATYAQAPRRALPSHWDPRPKTDEAPRTRQEQREAARAHRGVAP